MSDEGLEPDLLLGCLACAKAGRGNGKLGVALSRDRSHLLIGCDQCKTLISRFKLARPIPDAECMVCGEEECNHVH